MHLEVRQESASAQAAAAKRLPTLPLSGNAVKAVVCSVIFSVLGTVAVILRFYARRLKKAPYGLEDWLVLASLVRFHHQVPNHQLTHL